MERMGKMGKTERTGKAGRAPRRRAAHAALALLAALALCPAAAGCGGAGEAELAAKRAEAGRYADRVELGMCTVSAINEDGTVQVTTSFDEDLAALREQTAGWEGVVELCHPDINCVLGRTADGRVLQATYTGREWYDVAGWEDVVQLAYSHDAVYGLRSDGTVYAATYLGEDAAADVGGWEGVVALESGSPGSRVFGVTEDGHVLIAYHEEPAVPLQTAEVRGWEGVTDFAFDYAVGIGLRGDGTVLTFGMGEELAEEAGGWEGVVQVACGGHDRYVAGLTADGRVLVASEADAGGRYQAPDPREVSRWRDVACIAGANSYLLGLTADGEVLFAGRDRSFRNSHFRDTGRWDDALALYVSDPSFAVLCADGTIDGYVTTPISNLEPLW